MPRGFAIVGLDRPKFEGNIGTVARTCFVFGAAGLVVSGQRYRREASDTAAAHRHMPITSMTDLLYGVPYGAELVAVEIVDEAIPLPKFQHPERAFYAFGPEDGSINAELLRRAQYHVMIPSRNCLNLATAVGIVLYDRAAKRGTC